VLLSLAASPLGIRLIVFFDTLKRWPAVVDGDRACEEAEEEWALLPLGERGKVFFCALDVLRDFEVPDAGGSTALTTCRCVIILGP